MRYVFLLMTLVLILTACGGEEAIHSEDDITTNDTLLSLDFEEADSFETGIFTEVSARWNHDDALSLTAEQQISQHQSAENASVSIQARLGSEFNQQIYGVLCNADADINGYAFLVKPTGESLIARSDAGELTPLGEWSTPIESVDSLIGTCANRQLTLSLNGEVVSEAEDDTYSNSDLVGSILTADSEAINISDGTMVLDLNDSAAFDSRTYSRTHSDLSIADSRFQISHDSTGSSYIWAQGGDTAQNVSIEVQAEPQNDFANNLYGVMCRVNEDGAGYAFLISSDGFGAIARTDGNSLSFVRDWIESDAINDGQSANTIRAVCIDDYLALYVNDEFVADAENDRYPDAGQVGLIGGVFVESDEDGGEIIVSFDDLSVAEASLD